jgi:nucleotide-binding universal stress UspA family protein
MAVGGGGVSSAAGVPRIVVGVDGSSASVAALRWAIGHAELLGARVQAVTGYEVPWTILLTPTYTDADYARDAEEALDRSVAEASCGSGVEVQKVLIQERPALALTHLADGAVLLVVGSHGRGELPGMHLGSVSGYCVHHAPCPVLVHRTAVPG